MNVTSTDEEGRNIRKVRVSERSRLVEIPGYPRHVVNLEKDREGLVNFLTLQGHKKREIERVLKDLDKKDGQSPRRSRLNRGENRFIENDIKSSSRIFIPADFYNKNDSSGTDRLYYNHSLGVSGYLKSGDYTFYNQNDGNLVITVSDGPWSIGGGAPGILMMQDDGNLVLKSGGKVVDATGRNNLQGSSRPTLLLTSDGSLMIATQNGNVI